MIKNTGSTTNLKCPCCNNKSYFYKRLKEVSLYQCDNCNHRFTDINNITNNEKYSNNYYEEKHNNWFDNPNIRLFEDIWNQINALGLENPAVLDVGCGNGDFLRFLHNKNRRMQLSGIDYHENPPEEGINFICGDIFDPGLLYQYDVIVNLAVIEHVWDVKKYADRLQDLCKSNGLIVTMTVNDSSVIYGVARFIYPFGIKGPMERLYEKHHFNHFSWKSLEYLFKNNLKLGFVKHSRTPDNIDAVDFPKSNSLLKGAYKISIFILFLVGRLPNKALLQTLVVKKDYNE